MFHHSLLPVHWSVVILAWFIQLCLVLYSVLPTTEPHAYMMNIILTVFYFSTTTLNYRIHTDKIKEFIEIIKEEDLERLREEEMKGRVIAEYLAGSYGNNDNMYNSDGSTIVSDSVDENIRKKDPNDSESIASISTTHRGRGRGLASIATVSSISYMSEQYSEDHSNSKKAPPPKGPPPNTTRQKSGEETVALARQALQINIRMHGGDSHQTASSLLSLADVLRTYNNEMENSEVILLYEQSIDIFKRVQGISCVNVAVSENQLGNAYLARAEKARDAHDLEREQANLEFALPHYREAARILKVNHHFFPPLL